MSCISVIVAVYNVEPYLEKCLQSICNQTYKELEIIVVDDGSTDASGEICDRIAKQDKRVKVIHKENGGVSSSRNVGLACATGEYVTFVDGDDYIENTMYEKMYAEAVHEKLQMVICSFKYVYHTKIKTEGSPFTVKRIKKENYLDALLKDAFAFYYSVVWNKLIRKDVLTQAQICFDEQWKIMEDYQFVLRLLPQLEQIGVCHDGFYYYRKNNVQTLTNREIPFEESFKNRCQGYFWLKECLENCGYYEGNQKKLADYLIRYLASQYSKALFGKDRKHKLSQHKEIKNRKIFAEEMSNVSGWYKKWRKIYWGIKYTTAGLIQKIRVFIKR